MLSGRFSEGRSCLYRRACFAALAGRWVNVITVTLVLLSFASVKRIAFVVIHSPGTIVPTVRTGSRIAGIAGLLYSFGLLMTVAIDTGRRSGIAAFFLKYIAYPLGLWLDLWQLSIANATTFAGRTTGPRGLSIRAPFQPRDRGRVRTAQA